MNIIKSIVIFCLLIMYYIFSGFMYEYTLVSKLNNNNSCKLLFYNIEIKIDDNTSGLR